MTDSTTGPGRKYNDRVIINVFQNLLRPGSSTEIPIQVMQPIPQPRRPSNRKNLANIIRDLDNGFLGTEAIIVWKSGSTYFVVYGNQRYQAAMQKGTIRFIPCYVVRDLPNPEIADLCYANLVSSVLGPQPLSRSFVSKVIELRTVISWYLLKNPSRFPGAVTPNDVEEEMKMLLGGESSALYRRHWCKETGTTTFRKMVFIAKVCLQFKMEDEFDSLERLCVDTDAQVSARALYKVMTLESRRQGSGKVILSRFLSVIQGSASRRNNRLTLLSAEEKLFTDFTSTDSQEKGNAAKRSRTSGRAANITVEGIAICESGVKKLEDGLKTLQKGDLNDEKLRMLKKKIDDIRSYISELN